MPAKFRRLVAKLWKPFALAKRSLDHRCKRVPRSIHLLAPRSIHLLAPRSIHPLVRRSIRLLAHRLIRLLVRQSIRQVVGDRRGLLNLAARTRAAVSHPGTVDLVVHHARNCLLNKHHCHQHGYGYQPYPCFSLCLENGRDSQGNQTSYH